MAGAGARRQHARKSRSFSNLRRARNLEQCEIVPSLLPFMGSTKFRQKFAPYSKLARDLSAPQEEISNRTHLSIETN